MLRKGKGIRSIKLKKQNTWALNILNASKKKNIKEQIRRPLFSPQLSRQLCRTPGNHVIFPCLSFLVWKVGGRTKIPKFSEKSLTDSRALLDMQ